MVVKPHTLLLRLFFCVVSYFACPAFSFAAGLVIPANCTLDVAGCALTIPGDVSNAGTLSISTGSVSLTGNWLNSGTFSSGTSTVTFNATGGVQTLDTGGLAHAFYNLTHNDASTVTVATNQVDVNNNFTNSAGIFDSSSLNLFVGKDWNNTATYTPGTNTVTLDGTSQTVYGSTTFYNFKKQIATADTLTFSANGAEEQTVTHILTLKGAVGQLLSLEKSGANSQAKLKLQVGGAQQMQYLNVHNNNATGLMLVAGLTSFDSGNNTNWAFGNVTVTWTGVSSTDWDDPFNWDLGLSPAPGDTAIVTPVGGTIVFQPTLSTNVTIGNLTIQSGALVTLDGKNLTVSTTFSNSGNLQLKGNETLNITQDTVNPGTFTYLGTNTGATITIKDFGATDYYNLVINDGNGTPDTFITNANLNLTGSLSVSNSTLNTSTNSNTVTIASNLNVNGGTLTATNSTIDVNGNVSISNGTLTAPSGTTNTTFTIAGNFAHTAGTFTANGGKVTLDGTAQTVTGNTTFYQLRKVVAALDTLTFGAGQTQTVTNDLTLTGAVGQLLSLRSNASPTQASLTLQAGATQTISYVNVKDNNASGGLELVARNASVDELNNLNWIFGAATITWDGSTSTSWDVASNWNKGLVPNSDDTVIIPDPTATSIPNQPTLASNVTVNNLTIDDAITPATDAALTTAGFNLSVTSSFSNNGNVRLRGMELITLTMDSTHGTFTYIGDGDTTAHTRVLTINGSTNPSYNNLVINDANATAANRDTFVVAGTMAINSNLTVTSSTLTAAASTSVDVAGNVSIGASGTLTAPSAVTDSAFTVGGSWSNVGTFNHSSGKVTLDGTAQSMSGNSTFYRLRKIVAAADTLTFAASSTQTVVNDLTLSGAAGQLLGLHSSASPTQANLVLQAGGTQAITHVDVMDSNATGGVFLVARNTYNNGGNNIHWIFGAATITWDGSTSTDWDTQSNWDLGLVPSLADTVIIANAGSQPATLATNVSMYDLNVSAGATLSLVGHNLTVTNALSNDSTIILEGTETVEIATADIDSGTFSFTGTGAAGTFTMQITDPTTHTALASEFYNITINDTSNLGTFIRGANLTLPGALTISGGNFDISGNTKNITVAGNISITAGTLTATDGNIDANGAVAISGTGTLVAPTTGKSFTIAGSFSRTGAAVFTNSTGRVTLDSTGAATITGDTTFYDFYATGSGKPITFTAGSNQTITHQFNFVGASNNMMSLRSSVDGSKWSVTFPNSTQISRFLDVKDSDALTNVINCVNCTNSLNNNANWFFTIFRINAPFHQRTIGSVPTIIGVGPANTNVYIRGLNPANADVIVATARTDANGNFRVVLGNDADTDVTTTVTPGTTLKISTGAYDNYLAIFLIDAFNVEFPGVQNDLTIVATPTTSQVPTITSPTTGQRVVGSKPTFTGLGKNGETVTVVANDADGALLLATVGTGTVDASGNYSFALTTALKRATNYLSVTVDGVASELITLSLTDPFGVVFDSSTSKLIKNATVSIYKQNGQLAVPGVDLDVNDVNPLVTTANGAYSFLAAQGNYYMLVSAGGYDYPSLLTTFPVGRTIVTGSKGEGFTVGSDIIEMDHPVDGNGFLLRIEKDANKAEARIGDVVTYSIRIENLSADNAVDNILIDDKIPAGFKYLSNRVLLDGVPLAEPTGGRPLIFSIGTLAPGQIKTLRYQLVIGSGVVPGSYINVAKARYETGVVISNTATKTVKIVMDPLFDLGSVIGKVFYDLNDNGIQDAPVYDPTESTTIIEKPVPNVQIVTEDGTVVTTDREGKYNIPGILPGRHILRLDERTLPPGTFLTTDKALVIDVTQGLIVKANFGVNVDSAQVVGKDAQYFNEKIALTQDRSKPVTRLNVALFAHSPDEGDPKEEIIMYSDALVRQVEFRIFTNYSPFIDRWRLSIIDSATKKLVKRFEGTKLNIFEPLFWNGRGDDEKPIRSDHSYAYTLTVYDAKGHRDTTIEKPIGIQLLTTEEEFTKEKEKDLDKDKIRNHADQYQKWSKVQAAVNSTDKSDIRIEGETVKINRQGQDVRSVRILKDGQYFAEVPVEKLSGLTPQELMAAGSLVDSQPDHLEVVLPSGDYTLEITGGADSTGPVGTPSNLPLSAPGSLPSVIPPGGAPTPALGLERYTRKIKVGDDYFMFVGMGDAQVGYSFNRGNVESVAPDDRFSGGFWKKGKAAYYLKGKIKGKYLVTSSLDSEREKKALFRKLDPETYYPIYGDQSSINYDATNTKGPLYLLVEWDKSSVIWGNYAVDFNDSEFAAFSRNYYGGKVDYQSVASNPYGDARTKVVVFHAEVQQRPSHNEMLGTGGSLYFFKHKSIVEGSDKVKLEVRDKITGLVLASKEMKNGADYELDESEGRLLFWMPVSMIAKAESIVVDSLLDGNPVYVVADYQYEVKDQIAESSEGVRVAQAIGDNVVVGNTYVKETQADKNSTLKGSDVTARLGPDATVKAEYAQTQSTGTSSYVSTDGGISFDELTNSNTDAGKAYGIKGDARLFDRIGLNSYYKWVENSFATAETSSQQGKQLAGLQLTFDMTPMTRLTARQDIQRLIQNGNLQTQAQVGANETTVTMMQIVHESERLTLTGAYEIKQVKDKKDGIVSTSNEVAKTLAGKVEYAINGRVGLSLGQQFDVIDKTKNITTVGASVKLTDNFTARVEEAFSRDGAAITWGGTANVNDKLAFSSAYTVDRKKTGEIDKTASVGMQRKLGDKISTAGTVAVTESSTGSRTTTASVATSAKVNDNASVEAVIGKVENTEGGQRTTSSLGATLNPDKDSALKTTFGVNKDADGTQTKSVALDATRKVDDKTDMSSKVQVDENAQGGKTTTISFADKSQLNKELQAVSERTFGIAPGESKSNNKYSLIRTKDGKNLEASVSRQLTDATSNVSQSNIFGLTGDVNDKLALQGSMEKGGVQNLDGTRTDRTAFALGAGYVLKDTELAVERLKNSTKIELRLDDGDASARQFVFYNALEGRVTDNLSVSAKFEYSKTEDTDNKQTLARHKEIILGAAYRPVNFDNLNFIGRYTYQENQGPNGQVTDSGVERNRMQVVAAEAIYDINENWQLAEKFALRINDEKVTGFDFNRTHTWLMIHRINYRLDRNWTIGGEYRKLTQVEAKDSRQGFLLEATRDINANTQLGIGWNFTQFSDDMTNLNFTSQGPFLRMTGKLYDRTPEEKARARAKWLDERINQWAWGLVKKEISKPDSKVVGEMNRLFAVAQGAQKAGQYEQAQQVYKDVIMAGQMMFDEASEYIRSRIAVEEKLQEYNKTAEDYLRSGEYIKARKLWEKIVDDAQKRVVQ